MKKTVKKKQVHIMDSVDILDRVDIQVFQYAPGHFDVNFNCKEKGKRLIIDEKAKQTLSEKLTSICKDHSANHENTRGYIEEFTGRLLQKYHKCDLAVIEDIPEGIEDHYAHLRKLPLKKD